MNYGALAVTALIGLFVLTLAEVGYRFKWWRGEGARKWVHITLAIFIATWPQYLDWFEIRLISIALVIGFIVCMRLNLFKSIGSVKRMTYGEVLFALMIGAISLVTTDPLLYAVAMLHLGLADGLAALVGLRFGRDNRYKVFGQAKSLIGSGAFLAVSVLIMAVYNIVTMGAAGPLALVLVPVVATIAENIGVYGFDNLLVPASVLGTLAIIL